MMPLRLPQPDIAALAHSERVLAAVKQRIEQGPCSFAEYMNLVLYGPGLGYYAVGTTKFGRGGDFITAPELSPVFAACLARNLVSTEIILEFGAGSGQLCIDLLKNLDSIQQYWILEVSPDLRARQQANIAQALGPLAGKVQWLDSLPAQPFTGAIIANEVLDAMPVERLQWTGETLLQSFVTYTDQLTEVFLPSQLTLPTAVPPGYISELNLQSKPWLNSLYSLLNQGLVLIIDYGYPRAEYYHPQRHMGTLMCHYQHYAHTDAFLYPGIQDITAHVDFTTVAQSEFDLLGFTNQANFLLSSGLAALARPEDSAAIKTLVMPQAMGEKFKVMALGKQINPNLLGFSGRDYRGSL